MNIVLRNKLLAEFRKIKYHNMGEVAVFLDKLNNDMDQKIFINDEYNFELLHSPILMAYFWIDYGFLRLRRDIRTFKEFEVLICEWEWQDKEFDINYFEIVIPFRNDYFCWKYQFHKGYEIHIKETMYGEYINKLTKM